MMYMYMFDDMFDKSLKFYSFFFILFLFYQDQIISVALIFRFADSFFFLFKSAISVKFSLPMNKPFPGFFVCFVIYS